MGKPKKGKKGHQDDDFGDDDIDVDPLANKEDSEEVNSVKPATKAGKKGKKKKKDDWEDDVAADIAELSLQQKQDDSDMSKEEEEPVLQQKNKKKDKKKSKKKVESDDEDMDAEEVEFARSKIFPTKGKGGFSMLMDDDDDSVGEPSSDDEQPVKQPENKNTTKKQKSVEEEQNKENDEGKSNQKKKGKKDKKKKKGDEEDLDALLAEIVGKEAPEKGTDFKDLSSMTQEENAKAMEAEYDEEDDKKKKKKKKKGENKVEEKQEKVDDENEDDEEGDDDEEGEEGGTVKTAAQKKKEKKERQKQKKLEEKAKQKNKKNKQETAEETKDDKVSEKMDAEILEDKSEKLDTGTPEDKSESATKKDGEEEKPAEDKDEEEADEDDKKKKKKDRRKKKGEKEEEKETKKKPSKMAKLIQEQQQKIKEEEERIRLEMEEKERKIEEAIEAKQEEARKLKEKKEKEKQKKREKIEKQKKEGTFLTAKQKEAQKRAQQMLEVMKAQGYSIAAEEAPKKKKPVYEKKKKKPLSTQGSVEDKEPEVVTPVEEKSLVIEKVEVKKTENIADVKDAWDASDDEVKDAWDAESDTEVKPSETEVPEKKARVSESSSKKEGESEGEEDEEDSEEESSEDESEEEDSSEDESSSDDDLTVAEKNRQKALNRIQKRKETAEKNITTDVLRAAVVVVLGHVDTGKTKILDKLRRTNVQDNEAGGITQQIGATNVPVEAIRDSTKMCKEFSKQELKLPGLLIIDTPGHESFSNLRSRGSSLCDIAILVVDIMHGLEPQTIESINLLKERKCPFVVALNKIDRLYGWQPNPHSDVVNVIKKQKQNTRLEFEERAQQVMVQFAEQGLNAKLFYENKNPKEYISLVPTSAHSGDGMGSLVALVCELSQTHLAKKLAYSEELQATVMEVKAIHGLGTTIDVILVNGKLNEGDTIIVPGTEGPIVTQIRGLLMPQPMKELRVKNAYEHHKEVKAAQGVKIIAKDLDHSLAGLPVYVAHMADEIDIHKEEVKKALEDILSSIKLQEKGVFVQASTLGSLEALLQFLKDSKIPYAGINIGPIHKKDVMKVSVMLDRDPQYAVLLAFDVKVEREAQDLGDSLGIRIFSAEIIYHLFDSFMAYREEYKKSKQDEFKNIAVFPCKLRVLPQCIFNSRDPIVMGVSVEAGFLKIGTPICVPSKENVFLGQITSLEINHKQMEKATKGQEVCIKIENIPGETPKLYGRHFDHTDMLISKITRESIDAVKNYFRDEMGKSDWQLILELKKLFEIL